MEVLAHAASLVIEPGVCEQVRSDEIAARLVPMMEQGGPVVVLQPIVELSTGERVGAEALSRFPADWGKAPDVCFAEAHSIGLGHELELLALARAADHLGTVDGYVSMNVSPATLLTPECARLLRAMPVERVLLELSEHDPVDDYDALRATLDPLRARGMRLAIDDVGAGFSSLRHIVVTAPEVIKLDRTLVDGVTHDPVLRTLVGSLAGFAHGCDASVVAEGVETLDDAATLLSLGVDHGQGWHFGRPGPAGNLAPCPPRAVLAAAPSASSPRAAAAAG
jgi:EAL domain-containing protein (putative c-di-GMP-specific phosphodiesterase class I)